MAIITYTIPAEKIVHSTSVDFSSRFSIINPIHIVQYDNSLPIISVELKNDNKTYVLPSNIEVWIRWKKPDNTFVRKQALGCNSERNTVYFEITQQMVMQYGLFKPVVELIIPSNSSNPSVASSGYFSVLVDRNPIQNGDIESMTEYEDPYKTVCYTKTEIDSKLSGKLDNTTGSVKTDNIASNAVTTEKIANGAITALKLAIGAVSGNNIADNQINKNHLQDGAVTTDKLADDVKTTINGKATKATTIEGYGINDAYTKSETDNMLSGKLNNTAGSVKTDNIANKVVTSDKIANGAITALKLAIDSVSGSNIGQNQIGTKHLNNGVVTTDKLADEVKTSINSKYDNSNVETGSGTLTPYTTSADIVKSADFTYQRVGRVVTLNVNIVFNAGTKSQVMFTNLPYVCKNTVNPRELCVSNSKVTRIWAINKNNTTLSIFSDSSLSYAEDETLAFTLSYLVS